MHRAKVLMRVDWGCCAPTDDLKEAASRAAEGDEADEVRRVQRDIVQRASSLGPPQKRLRRSMREQAEAPLEAYVLNEVELHPGFYVDWDADPDATIEPLARAYGEHCCALLAEARARA